MFFLQEKCSQYWPSEGSTKYGTYTVEMKNDNIGDAFSLRDLTVTNTVVGITSDLILTIRVSIAEYVINGGQLLKLPTYSPIIFGKGGSVLIPG